MRYLCCLCFILPRLLRGARRGAGQRGRVAGGRARRDRAAQLSPGVHHQPGARGAVTSFADRLAPAELILPKEYNGLCMDHFQEQGWPGELLEAPYDYTIVKQTPEEAQVMVKRVVSGIWQAKLANKQLANLTLEKTYTLRADSPALVCAVKLSAPVDESKVFSYWLQNVFFAGGKYDEALDRTFRPSTRGVRSNAAAKNGMYGTEDWMRDFSDGWMALLDTVNKTGLATMTDYNDLRINYANFGNHTNEFMFNTTFLPKGASRSYTITLMPVLGMDKMLYVGPDALVGYHIATDNKGEGHAEFTVTRSAEAVNTLTLTVAVAGADGGKEVPAGTLTFNALADAPQTKTLALTGLPHDPIVVRISASGQTVDGKGARVPRGGFLPRRLPVGG